MGLKKDRPKITRSNFVCAEPMPGEKQLLEDFLKTLREDRLEELIRRVMQVPEDTTSPSDLRQWRRVSRIGPYNLGKDAIGRRGRKLAED